MTLAKAPALQPTRLAFGAHLAAAAPSAPEAAEPARAPQPSGIPQAGSELTDLSQENYNLEASAAVTLGFSVVSLKANVEHDVLVYQVARYKDVAGEDGTTFRFGVAVEATIVVTVEKFEGGLTLPAVAANVQLGHATASSDLAVRGYGFTPESAVTLPAWGSFDVDSYTDFQKAIDSIVAKVLFDNPNIHPVLLATTAPPSASPDTTPPPHRFTYKLGKWLEGKDEQAPSQRVTGDGPPVAGGSSS
jgi:hypothetical protein